MGNLNIILNVRTIKCKEVLDLKRYISFLNNRFPYIVKNMVKNYLRLIYVFSDIKNNVKPPMYRSDWLEN